MKEIFEIDRLLMSGLPYHFLLEVIFRCVVMYIVALIVLKLAGRRGIKQLSIFELVIILTLGSAAGDPLFYEDVGLIPTITVFVIILLLYKITTTLISKSTKIEHWLEGKPLYLIEEGEFSIHNFKKESLSIDEFFAELRAKNITHLGQVKLAILETSGEVNVFFMEDENVKYGLPVLPHVFNKREKELQTNEIYACRFCGNIQQPKMIATDCKCNKCGKENWVKAVNEKRVT